MSKWIEKNNEIMKRQDNGMLSLHKDKEAVHAYFVDYVNNKMKWFHDLEEKIEYLLDYDYYDRELFDKYEFADIKKVYKRAYSHKFRFESFMAAKKFYDSYALKTDDGSRYLERFEDRMAVNALFFANGNVEEALRYVDVLVQQILIPATPTMLNAGRKRSGEKVSCFLIDVPDSTEGIMYAVESASQLSRMGGGVGLNLTNIRARGEAIKGVHNAASGVVGLAKIFEDVFSHFNQLNQRQGSGVGYLSVMHADIFEFLSTRNINIDEKKRLKTLSIGALIPNVVYEKAKNNESYYAFYPHNLKQVTGKALSDIDMREDYESLINNPDIKKVKIDARKLLTEIARVQLESGYPYVINIDNANDDNHLHELAPIKMSNLCTEIFQPQTPSDVKGRLEQSHYGYDISCNLSSLQMVNLVEKGNIEESIDLAIRGLNHVVDTTNISTVPTVMNANQNLRSIGLGFMGYHGLLAKNKMTYGCPESKELANIMGMILRFYSLKSSNQIAIETQPYAEFSKSDYAKGKGLEKYLTEDFNPTYDKVKKVLENVHIPTKSEWKDLIESIEKHGVANSFVNAQAPTGNISFVANSTPSLMPVTEQVEARHYDNSTTYFPMPHLSAETYWFYNSAYDIDMLDVIDVIAEFQKHFDQGISATMFVNSDTNTEQLFRMYAYSQHEGLKSLYYTRTRNVQTEQCISCSI